MAIREKRSGGWFLAVLGLLAVTVFSENVASALEATGLNRLWAHTGFVGTILAWLWAVFTSPVATHFYAFVAGVLACVTVGSALSGSGSQGLGELNKPDLALHDLVRYLTSDTKWAKQNGFISDRMIEHELLDALSCGKLHAFARKYDEYGSTSPLYRIDDDTFTSLKIDLDAVRLGRRDTIVLKPGYFGDTNFHDWRFFSSQAEQLWPRWEEPKPPAKAGIVSKFRRAGNGARPAV